MLVYSFLTKEFRGGVIWEPTLAAYDQFLFDRGLFGDDPPTIEWAYISIFIRSILKATQGRHDPVPAHRLSHRLLHRHAARPHQGDLASFSSPFPTG